MDLSTIIYNYVQKYHPQTRPLSPDNYYITIQSPTSNEEAYIFTEAQKAYGFDMKPTEIQIFLPSNPIYTRYTLDITNPESLKELDRILYSFTNPNQTP